MIVKQVVLSKNGKVDRQQTLALLAVKQTAEKESIILQGIEADIAELWTNILSCKIFDQLDDPVLVQIRDQIKGLDINSLTPIEALNKLNEIKKITGI